MSGVLAAGNIRVRSLYVWRVVYETVTTTYTYFQHEPNVYTWIDLILNISEHSQSDQNITRCFIHACNEHNMSDHLLLSFVVEWNYSASDIVTGTCTSRRTTPN